MPALGLQGFRPHIVPHDDEPLPSRMQLENGCRLGGLPRRRDSGPRWHHTRSVDPAFFIDGDAKLQPCSRLQRRRHIAAHVVPIPVRRLAAQVGGRRESVCGRER